MINLHGFGKVRRRRRNILFFYRKLHAVPGIGTFLPSVFDGVEEIQNIYMLYLDQNFVVDCFRTTGKPDFVLFFRNRLFHVKKLQMKMRMPFTTQGIVMHWKGRGV